MEFLQDEERCEKTPLCNDVDTSNDNTPRSLNPTNSSTRASLWWIVVLQAILLAGFTVVGMSIIPAIHQNTAFAMHIYTPAAEAVHFRAQDLDGRLFDDNPFKFKGSPTPDTKAAWDALFQNSYIRLSEDELTRLNRTSTPIQDGSGDFLGSPDAYHQLHCVRYIHEYVHPEFYTIEKTNIDIRDHVDHCIDMIRQVIQCHADPAIMTFSYHSDHPIAWPEFDMKHECRSWEALDSWAGQPGRAVENAKVHELSRNPDYTGGMFDGHDD